MAQLRFCQIESQRENKKAFSRRLTAFFPTGLREGGLCLVRSDLNLNISGGREYGEERDLG